LLKFYEKFIESRWIAEMLGRSCETRPRDCHVGKFSSIVVAREFRLGYRRSKGIDISFKANSQDW
jgi:hypothetical protein